MLVLLCCCKGGSCWAGRGRKGEEKHFTDAKNFPLPASLLHRSAAGGTGEQRSCALIYTHIPTCINFSCVHSVSGSLGAVESHPRRIAAAVKTDSFCPSLFSTAQPGGCPRSRAECPTSFIKSSQASDSTRQSSLRPSTPSTVSPRVQGHPAAPCQLPTPVPRGSSSTTSERSPWAGRNCAKFKGI